MLGIYVKKRYTVKEFDRWIGLDVRFVNCQVFGEQ